MTVGKIVSCLYKYILNVFIGKIRSSCVITYIHNEKKNKKQRLNQIFW